MQAIFAHVFLQDVSACNSSGCSSQWPGMLPAGSLASAAGLLLQPLSWVCICMEVGGTVFFSLRRLKIALLVLAETHNVEGHSGIPLEFVFQMQGLQKQL